MLEHALEYQSLGYDVCPLKEQSKGLALKGGLRAFSSKELRNWFAQRQYNLGILLGEVVVLDADGEEGENWIREHGYDTSPMIAASPHGLHYYFRVAEPIRTRIKYLGLPLDLKATAHIVAPPSRLSTEEQYRWLKGPVPKIELPLLTLPDEPPRIQPKEWAPVSVPPSRYLIRNPRRYCLKIPSIEGQNGSKALMRCCYVCLSNGMTAQETFEFLIGEWNDLQAIPTWPESDIRHAIESALKKLGN